MSCCDNSSYHDIKQGDRGSSPPNQPPPGPARSPPLHLGLKLALRGATRRKCEANSFFLSGLYLSIFPPALFHSVLLSLPQPLRLHLSTPPPPPLSLEILEKLFYLSKFQKVLFPVSIENILLSRHPGCTCGATCEATFWEVCKPKHVCVWPVRNPYWHKSIAEN